MPSCAQCGMHTRTHDEYHPFLFCVLMKAGHDPWPQFKATVESYGLGPLPESPPRIRNLPKTKGEQIGGRQNG